MAEQNLVDEVFFKYLLQFSYNDTDLDYSVMNKHKIVLQTLADIGNSGIGVFDMSKRQMVFYSSNFGKLLGYNQSDYEKAGQEFFYNKIHPDYRVKLGINGISVMKIFHNFSIDDKLSHKSISEYRMLNTQNKYVRLVEQYQVLELDKTGQ